MNQTEHQKGLIFAFAAYIIWGFFPFYFKALSDFPALEILCHRIVWSAILLSAVLAYQGAFDSVKAILFSPKQRVIAAVAALMIAINWGVYIWATNEGRIIESSLGYFIMPVLNVILGRFLFKETLTRLHLLSFVFVLIGIAWLTYTLGHLPWIALILAVSFAIYGVLRKIGAYSALAGLTVETYVLAPFALIALAWFAYHGGQAFWAYGSLNVALLMGCGVATTIPLLLFAGGVKRIDLVSMGLIQYITPTTQFLIGLLFFQEAFDGDRLIGYVLIWVGLLIFTVGLLMKYRNQQKNKSRLVQDLQS
jgi:chloramphenicol-sensitive protein RarD